MNFKSLGLLLFVCVINTALNAQDIKFDKKSGEFSSGGAVIAKLEDEKVKPLGGKNYFVKDAAGTEQLAYLLYKWEDTFGHPSIYYYQMRCTPLGLTAYRPNFTGMMNTFREVGEHVVVKNLLQPDGKINEQFMKGYFEAAQKEMGDYPGMLKAKNDSMAALANIESAPVERDKRKPITANEYGKIGQGNTVIGTWEFVEEKGQGFNSSTYHFKIKNMAGGIICISWIELSGSHTYLFKNGQRSRDDWKVQDLVNNNPIQNKQGYVVQLATRLVGAGML